MFPLKQAKAIGMEQGGTWVTPQGIEQKYKYNGKEHIGSGLGWYDYGARWYDPCVGRWISVDPLASDSEGWNPYNYVYNNPLRYIDPDGKFPVFPVLVKLAAKVEQAVTPTKANHSAFPTPKSSMISPVKDPVISSEYSPARVHPVDGTTKAHKGIDIVDADPSKTAGKDVVSATDGELTKIANKDDGNGAGNRIHVKDDEGNKHSYFHLDDSNFGEGLREGNCINQGTKIGEIGTTGKVTGAHLHYEIRDSNGQPQDPRKANQGLKAAPTVAEARAKKAN